MSTNISSYFVEELINWNHALNFYCNEIDELTDKLVSWSKNCQDAQKYEVQEHLDALRKIAAIFSKLQVEIFGHERLLQPSDGSLLSNSMIREKDVTSQDILRLNVQAAEKEFVEIKFRCYQLMASLLIKQFPVNE